MNSKNNLFITSNDFSSFSNLVYSDRVDKNSFDLNNVEIIEEFNDPLFNCVVFKKIKFKLAENQTIFCNTAQLDNLFYHLKKSKFKNINLITHQTDLLITKKIFNKKPKCIKNWYTVNAGFTHDNLKPIPIGIASSFSKKNLNSSDFKLFDENNFLNYEVSLYINFQQNTNFKERRNIVKHFQNEEWVTIDEPNLDKENYMKSLRENSFILCPWGNGIDTHRLWEVLYSGSIPITKKHPTYNYEHKLPILFVNNFEEVTYDTLKKFLDDFDIRNYDFSVLSIDFWEKKINVNQDLETNYEYFNETLIVRKYYQTKRYIKKVINSKIKKLVTFKNRILLKLRF